MYHDPDIRRRALRDTGLGSSVPATPRRSEGSRDDVLAGGRGPESFTDPQRVTPAQTRRDFEPRFLYNSRLLVLGCPCFLVLLLLGGKPAAMVATVGLMVCYSLDIVANKEGTLIAFWCTMLLTGSTLLWAARVVLLHSFLSFFQVAMVCGYVGLVAVWGTLQFRWLLKDEPLLGVLMENVLFAGFPLPSCAIVTWGAMSLWGADCGPYVLMVALTVCVCLYTGPLPSSVDLTGLVQSTVNGVVLWACLVVLPALMYFCMSPGSIWEQSDQDRAQSNHLALTIILPWILVAVILPRHWLSPPAGRADFHQMLLCTGYLAVMILGEFLVPELRPYLGREPDAWPSAAFLARLGWMLIWVAALVVHVGGPRSKLLMRGLAVAGVRLLTTAAGLPAPLQFLFDLTTLSAAMFVHSRRLIYYVGGCLGLVGGLVLFGRRTLWFLDFAFVVNQATGSSAVFVSLRAVTLGLCALGFLTLLVPGLVLLDKSPVLVGLLLICHGMGVGFVESVLVSAEGRDPALEGIYPLPLVIFTSAVGMLAVALLVGRWRLEPVFTWMVGCLHGCKLLGALVAFAGPGAAAFTEVLVTTLALGLAMTVPLGIYSGYAANGSAEAIGDDEPVMSPLEAVVLFLFTSLALWKASGPLVAPIVGSFLGGGADRGLNGAELLAVCGVIMGVYLLMLVGRHFPDSTQARRVSAGLLMASLVVAVVQPDLGTILQGPWGLDSESPGGGRHQGIAAALLVAAVYGLAILLGLVSATRTKNHTMVFSLVWGGCVGWAASRVVLQQVGAPVAWWSSVPHVLLSMFTVAMVLESLFPFPHAPGEPGLGTIYTGLMAWPGGLTALQVGLAVVREGLLSGRRIPRGHHSTAWALIQAHLMLSTISHALVALSLKLLLSAAPPVRPGPHARMGSGVGVGGTFGTGQPGHMRTGMATRAAATLGAGFQWVPVLCNLSTLLAFGGSAVMCYQRLHTETARALAMLPLSTLLLLLHEDGRALAGLGAHNRYAPVVAGASCCWAGTACYYVLLRGLLHAESTPYAPPLGAGGAVTRAMAHMHHSHGAAMRAVSVWTAGSPLVPLWNLAMVLITGPSIARLVRYMWGRGTQKDLAVVWTLAITLVPILGADLVSTRLLGVLGLLGGCSQLWFTKQQRQQGMRLI